MAINLKQALAILESGDWCQLTYVTADVKKGTGGKLITFARCRIAQGHALNVKSHTETKKSGATASTNSQKNPNHNLHFTRNVQLPNKMVRTIHPILITLINSQPVI